MRVSQMIEDSYRHRGMRRGLIKSLREKGIKDPEVLLAMEKVPRHVFFDKAFLEHAYQDKAFPIGEGQTISQPYTVAVQTELMEIKPGDKVLEIGTGSGYQCCILLEMGAKVYTIEYVKALYLKAKNLLSTMGYHAYFIHGDGSKGFAAFAPYDKIIVTAGAPNVPECLIEQLATPGKLVIPVGGSERQEMVTIEKLPGNKIVKKKHNYFSFVPLVGEKGWKK
jgi:protein-L-isoaspartate(D-aspartate) O-methyltransferase